MKTAPWYRVNKAALELLRLKQISPTDLAVLNAICARADAKGPRDCWPGLVTLAKDLGFHKTTIIRSAARLENVGLLKIENRSAKNGQTKSNRYILVDEVPHSILSTMLEGSPSATEGSPSATEGSPSATQTRSIEQDPTNKTAICIDLDLEEEQKTKLSEIEISEGDLQNPEILQTVFQKCVELGYALDSERHLQEFFTAAIHARASGAEPLKLFWSFVWKGEFLRRSPKIGSEDEFEQAQAWRRELKRRESERRFGRIPAEWSKGPVSMAAALKRILPAILHSQN